MTLIATLATTEDQLASPYADLTPAMTPVQALAESNRCLFCYDAPCIKACPTGIDIPAFIRSIATGNLKGAATTILSENIMGGTCGRVCPTETLCEQSCVRNRRRTAPSPSAGCNATPPTASSTVNRPIPSRALPPPASASPWSVPARPACPVPTASPRSAMR